MGYPVYAIPSGTTLYHLFDTFGASGESLTMSNFAVGDIKIYKNGSVTERSSTSGFTLLDTDGTDFDSATGIHGFSVDLSDNTDSGFFTVGAWYHVVVNSITINGQTVRFVACAFRIVAAEATAGYPVATLKVGTGTGEINLSSGGVPLVDDAIAASKFDESTAFPMRSDKLRYTVGAIGRGTAQASGSSATAIATSTWDIAPNAADQFKGRVVLFDSNTTTQALRGVAVVISASTNSATPVFTVGTMPATPANGDTFSVI